MNKILALSIAAIATTIMTGCVAEGGYGAVYGRPAYRSAYVDDYGPYSYGSYGYGGSRYAQEVIYIDGRACHHDRDSDRYYYSSGRDRVYISDEQYSRNRQAIARWKAEQNQKEAEAKYNYAKNKQKLESAQQQNEWKERQARYNYEQEKKQYQYKQKVASNQAELDRAKYKANLNDQKKQWEYQQKAAEYKQREAVAKYKYENGIRSNDDDKKKKKH